MAARSVGSRLRRTEVLTYEHHHQLAIAKLALPAARGVVARPPVRRASKHAPLEK
jgi:hypothetical protein